MNQDTSYSSISRHEDPDIGGQGCHEEVELDQISQHSQPYKPVYNVGHDDAVSPLTDEHAYDTTYDPDFKVAPPTQLSKKKPEWETILADVIAIGAPLGLLIFAIILWLKDQSEAHEGRIREFQDATQVVSLAFDHASQD